METDAEENKDLPFVFIGNKYNLKHSRFGSAVVIVTDVSDDTFLDITVVKGTLRGLGAGAIWGPGESKRVRREHCLFTQCKE